MSNDDIKAYFDGSNITLAELSAMTGKTRKQLKTILMGAYMQATLTFDSRAMAEQFTKYWSRATLTGHTMGATGADGITLVTVYNVTDDSKALINDFIESIR